MYPRVKRQLERGDKITTFKADSAAPRWSSVGMTVILAHLSPGRGRPPVGRRVRAVPQVRRAAHAGRAGAVLLAVRVRRLRSAGCTAALSPPDLAQHDTCLQPKCRAGGLAWRTEWHRRASRFH